MSASIQLNVDKELYANRSYHFVGTLSPKSKHLLTLPEEERADGAVFELLSEMENIEFFSKFTNHTKELLAKKLNFVIHKANSVLLKQGVENGYSQALYIIISGVVTEHFEPQVTETECPILWPEKNLRQGDIFGHVDIVYNRLPTVNAKTVGYTELLKLSKEDFYIVHKEMEAHCAHINHYLHTTEAITRFGWSGEEFKVLEIYSKLCTFVKNQTIFTGEENNKQSAWSYIVVSGVCKISKELIYYVSDFGQLKAIPYQLRKELNLDNFITDQIEFEEVKKGFYFGVGENFIGNKVTANSTVECLLIPKLLLAFKNREILRKMAKDFTDSLPSDQEVLDDYSKLVSASKRKVQMLQELFKDKPERLNKN